MGSSTENANQNHDGHSGLKNLVGDTRAFFRKSPRAIGSYFVRGLIIILPLAITLWVLVWLFNLIDGFLSPVLEWGLGWHIPGLGFAIIAILVLLIGFVGSKIEQTKFFGSVERQIIRIPGIGVVYGGTRDIINTFHTGTAERFLEVVLIEYPRKGIFAIGFVTRENKDEFGKKVLTIFIPTAPTPAGGYLQIVPESEVVHTTISITDAMKLIVSIGRLSKEDFAYTLAHSQELKKGPE